MDVEGNNNLPVIPPGAECGDPATAALISEMILNDILQARSLKSAQRLQLHEAMRSSRRPTAGANFNSTLSPGTEDSQMVLDENDDEEGEDSDYMLALALSMDAQQVCVSRDTVEKMRERDTQTLRDTARARILSQRLTAEDTKVNIDREYARRLQEIDAAGELDIDDMKDVKDALSEQQLAEFMNRRNPNPNSQVNQGNVQADQGRPKRTLGSLQSPRSSGMGSNANNSPDYKGKGKRKEPSGSNREYSLGTYAEFSPGARTEYSLGAHAYSSPIASQPASKKMKPAEPTAMCGICLDPFRPHPQPYAASQKGASSGSLSYGLILAPCKHSYCVGCLTTYIMKKVEDQAMMVVFPIRCPECPSESEGLQDGTAANVLSRMDLDKWHHRKLVDSVPKFYCPNPKCSVMLERHEGMGGQCECPSCHTLTCFDCNCRWHDGLTCEQYQALPPDERSPEDRTFLQLVAPKNWKRCPKCSAVVELSQGCYHMTCRCSHHFCYLCLKDWDIPNVKCTSDPPCQLWDDEMQLLNQRERARIAQMERREADAEAERQRQRVQQVQRDLQRLGRQSLEWMQYPVPAGAAAHPPTSQMIHTLTCIYCNNRYNNVQDLQNHLLGCRHPVFSCCRRFFREQAHYVQHERMATRNHFSPYVKFPQQ